jgi:hypothetical protein
VFFINRSHMKLSRDEHEWPSTYLSDPHLTPAAAVPDNAPLDLDGGMCYESSEEVRAFLECLTRS